MSSDISTGKYQSSSHYKVFSRWQRVKEVVVLILLGWIPRLPGSVLRRLLYRTIVARIGRALYIEAGVELLGANYIEIGDEVAILRDVRLNAVTPHSKIRLGCGVSLERGVDIIAGNCHIEIGELTSLGPYTCIAGSGDIKIGKGCLISSHVGIYSNNHNFADPTRYICAQGITSEGIVIEDDCWLGTGVKVLDGVTIGRGSVIGAGAVVTKDIPPYSVAVGVPAKVMAHRDEKRFAFEKMLQQ